MKEVLPMAELKRRIAAELDRALGSKGTVTDVAIAPDARDGWRVIEVDTDAEPEALARAAETVLPKLHASLVLGQPGASAG